jgi:hypothetical protein
MPEQPVAGTNHTPGKSITDPEQPGASTIHTPGQLGASIAHTPGQLYCLAARPEQGRVCSSVLKKRRKKMTKHKYRKWRKKTRFLRRALKNG